MVSLIMGILSIIFVLAQAVMLILLILELVKMFGGGTSQPATNPITQPVTPTATSVRGPTTQPVVGPAAQPVGGPTGPTAPPVGPAAQPGTSQQSIPRLGIAEAAITPVYDSFTQLSLSGFILLLLHPNFQAQLRLDYFIQILDRLQGIRKRIEQQRGFKERLRPYNYDDFRYNLYNALFALRSRNINKNIITVRKHLIKEFNAKGIPLPPNPAVSNPAVLTQASSPYTVLYGQIDKRTAEHLKADIELLYTLVFSACRIYHGFENQLP